MRIYKAELLQKSISILTNLGCDLNERTIVADHLVEANLKGHDSHGVGMLVFYVDSIANKTLIANQEKKCINDCGPILQYDALRGFGQRIAKEAVDDALMRVKETGIVLLTVKNAHHLGRIGTYGEQVANAGKIGIFFVNVIDFPVSLVAPFAGSSGRFGTNPICITFPKTDQNPSFVLDFATSMVAYGKTRVNYLAKKNFDQNVMLDHQGHPTNDPKTMYEEPKGALRAIADHKGGGLISATEFIAGLLSGGGTNQINNPRLGGIVNNMTAIIIDPTKLVDTAWLQEEYDAMIDYIKSSPAPTEAVLMAGEPERMRKEEREAEGVYISEAEWNAILEAEKKAINGA